MFTLGYSFRPWDGEKSIADGASILQYIKDTARETGVDKHIRFNHRIVAADWSTDDARWHVTAERTDTSETFELTADFIFCCSGYYRYDQGYPPDFAGHGRLRRARSCTRSSGRRTSTTRASRSSSSAAAPPRSR